MRALAVAGITLATTSCVLLETFPDVAASADSGASDACDCGTDDSAIDDSAIDAGGPIAYYRGTGVDLSGHGNDALWQGAATLAPDRFLTPNVAASFDGTTYLEVATHPLLPLARAPRTVSVWVLTTHDYTKGAAGGLVNWGRVAPGERFGLLLAQPGEAYFVGETADVFGGPALNDGRWHNVVVTYDGKLLSLYVDVAFAGSNVIDLNTVGLALELGRSALGHTPEPYTGVLDEVRIYDRVLTSAERRAIYYANGWK